MRGKLGRVKSGRHGQRGSEKQSQNSNLQSSQEKRKHTVLGDFADRLPNKRQWHVGTTVVLGRKKPVQAGLLASLSIIKHRESFFPNVDKNQKNDGDG